MNSYKAYLFDLDGTLVDSEKLKGKALAETCGLFGGKVDVSVYKEVMGKSWNYVANHFFYKANIDPQIEEFNAEFKKIYQDLLQNELMPNPNIEKLLIKLEAKGSRMGIVSSGATWMVEQILGQLGFSRFFEVIIAKEDVSHHKPDPEAYLLALNKMSLLGSQALVFEDSESGLNAAKRANCKSIAFRHEFNAIQDLSLALRVITDFDEILNYEGF